MARPMRYAPREGEVMTILRARSLHMHGVRRGDAVQVTMALGLANGGIGTREALQRYNAAIAISTGSGNTTSSRRQIELARALEGNVLPDFIGKSCRASPGMDSSGSVPASAVTARRIDDACTGGAPVTRVTAGAGQSSRMFDALTTPAVRARSSAMKRPKASGSAV
jgi:hypothetical protein